MPADEEPKLASERIEREPGRHFSKLPYASTNWIRFEGSPCRVCADGLSVPCRDSPSCRVEAEANTNQPWRQFVTSFARRTAGLCPLAAARRCAHPPRGDRQDAQ
jgi:hypothetical protein